MHVHTAPAIALLSHGSRHPQADATVERLAAATAAHLSDLGYVTDGFAAHLDLSDDTLPAVACRAAERGHRELVVVPLLFTAAFHMKNDVPAAIQDAQQATGIGMTQADQIGLEPDLVELLAHRVRNTAGREGIDISKIALFSVGSTTPGANEAVEQFTDQLGRVIAAGSDSLGQAAADTVRASDGGRERQIPARSFVATGPASKQGHGPHDLIGWADPETVTIPLFASPGTLLDVLTERAHGGAHDSAASTPPLRLMPPLGEELAPVVAQRYVRAITRARGVSVF